MLAFPQKVAQNITSQIAAEASTQHILNHQESRSIENHNITPQQCSSKNESIQTMVTFG
jgi:hypothetical protein